MRRILPGRPVVRLRQASPPSVGPVQAVAEPDGVGGGVGPAHHLVGVVHNPSGPEEPLSVLGDQTIELILLGGSVQRDRLHPHGVAVRLGLVLLEGGAANLPSDDVPRLHLLCTNSIIVKQLMIITQHHSTRGLERRPHTCWFPQKY